MATKLKRRKDAGWQQRGKNRERHDKNARKKQFSLVRKRCENENIAVPEKKKHKKIKYKNKKGKLGTNPSPRRGPPRRGGRRGLGSFPKKRGSPILIKKSKNK